MKNPFSFVTTYAAQWASHLRQALVQHLAAQENLQVLPSTFPVGQVNVMGCAVMYYESRGFRHFVTLRKEDQTGDRANRFPGFMTLPLQTTSHLGPHQPIDALHALHEALERQLGENFCKRASLKKRMRHDTVQAVPMFMEQRQKTNAPTEKSMDKPTTNLVKKSKPKNTPSPANSTPQAPLQTLVWALPIQKKQLKNIRVPDGAVLETVPQFSALKGTRLQPLHQALLHSLNAYFAHQPLMVASEKELKNTIKAVEEYVTQQPTVH